VRCSSIPLTVACWGEGTEAGGGASPPAGEFREVGTGLGYSCGVTVDRRVVCWGSTFSGAQIVPADFP
jgi:hypothetical protein